MYHSRLYAAANYVKTTENLDLIQLNSFGCGLDAVTTDQVHRYPESLQTRSIPRLKIDEVNNLWCSTYPCPLSCLPPSVCENSVKADADDSSCQHLPRVPFTKEMRKEYTILCPQMSPIHFSTLRAGIPCFRLSRLKFFRMTTNRQSM